jgi:hypothetical protein
MTTPKMDAESKAAFDAIKGDVVILYGKPSRSRAASSK